ncbi:MAG: TonB-dependent receptor [Parasphingorhabdus sp.]
MSKAIQGYLAATILSGGALLLPANVSAQESQADDGFDKNVIVVTALKKSESLTDVPVAVTVFNGSNLDRLGIKDPMDLAGQTPGLTTTLNSVGAPSYSIRGVGLEDYIGNNSSGTALYIDEIYPVSAAMQGGRLFDVERVEILKGPQGTLYGRNSTGGAINVISAKPTSDLEGYVDLSFDSFEEINLAGAISGPITEGIMARAAVSYDKGLSGWQKGVSRSDDAGEADRLSGRLHLLMEPTDALSMLFTLHGERDNGINPSWLADDQVGFDGFLGIQFSSPQSADRIDMGDFFAGVDGVRSPKNDSHLWGGNFRLNYDSPIGQFTAITGWQTFDRDSYDNNDGSPATLADFHFRTKVDQFSQELRLSSDIGNVGNVILGAVYARDTIDVNDELLLTDTLNILSPAGFRPSDFGIEVTQSTNTRQKTRSLGFYAHSEWYLAPQFTVTLAGRYTDERRRFIGNVTDNTGYIIGGSGGIVVQNNDVQKEKDFSWRVGAEYKPSANSLIYGSIATGFKSGVFFSGPVPDPSAWGYVEPEKLTAYEVGFKTELFDIAQLNTAIFHYDYKNKQSNLFITSAFGPVATLGNIPKSRTNGAEIEMLMRPSDNLNLSLGVSYLDAEVRQIGNDVRGIPLFSTVTPGDSLTQSPTVTFNMAATLEQPISTSLLGTLQLTYAYTDEMVQFLSDPLANSEDIHDIGARISIEDEVAGWSAALFVRNLLDDDRRTFGYSNLLGNRTFALQRPRSVGVQIRWER